MGTLVIPSVSPIIRSPGLIIRSPTSTSVFVSIKLNGPCPGTLPVAHTGISAAAMPGKSLIDPPLITPTAPNALCFSAIPSPMTAPLPLFFSISTITPITGKSEASI